MTLQTIDLAPRIGTEIRGDRQTILSGAYSQQIRNLLEAQKKAIDRLRVVHMQETIQRHVFSNPSDAQVERWRTRPTKTHPLVWNHQSGRKSLVLGLTATHIEGMDPIEGRMLIRQL